MILVNEKYSLASENKLQLIYERPKTVRNILRFDKPYTRGLSISDYGGWVLPNKEIRSADFLDNKEEDSSIQSIINFGIVKAKSHLNCGLSHQRH